LSKNSIPNAIKSTLFFKKNGESGEEENKIKSTTQKKFEGKKSFNGMSR
jgi:hypothetical protein